MICILKFYLLLDVYWKLLAADFKVEEVPFLTYFFELRSVD